MSATKEYELLIQATALIIMISERSQAQTLHIMQFQL